MSKTSHVTLTCGSASATFDETLATVHNYGFKQSLFEVERFPNAKAGAAGKRGSGEILVLRPSSTQLPYPQVKPGDSVWCTGIAKNADGTAPLCVVRRMAEGLDRFAMKELSSKVPAEKA